jgi:hypothetical protein
MHKAKTISKDRVLLIPSSTRDEVTFFPRGAGLEACITTPEGDVTRFNIAPPEKGQHLAITRLADNSVEVLYVNNEVPK